MTIPVHTTQGLSAHQQWLTHLVLGTYPSTAAGATLSTHSSAPQLPYPTDNQSIVQNNPRAAQRA